MDKSTDNFPPRLFPEVMEAFKIYLLEKKNHALDCFEKEFWGDDHDLFKQLQLDIEIEQEYTHVDKLDLDEEMFQKQGAPEFDPKEFATKKEFEETMRMRQEHLELARPKKGYKLENNIYQRDMSLDKFLKKTIQKMFMVGGTVVEGKLVGGQIDSEFYKKYRAYTRKHKLESEKLKLGQNRDRKKLFSEFLKSEYPQYASSEFFRKNVPGMVKERAKHFENLSKMGTPQNNRVSVSEFSDSSLDKVNVQSLRRKYEKTNLTVPQKNEQQRTHGKRHSMGR